MITTYRKIADALGVRLYDRHSGDSKFNAQRNLSGRTHYVDSDTLKYFHSRIVSTHIVEDDSVFILIESTARDYQNRTRGFRFVAFDLTGTVLNDRGEIYYSTSDSARKAMWQWLENFSSLDHHRQVLIDQAERLRVQAAHMQKTADSI